MRILLDEDHFLESHILVAWKADQAVGYLRYVHQQSGGGRGPPPGEVQGPGAGRGEGDRLLRPAGLPQPGDRQEIAAGAAPQGEGVLDVTRCARAAVTPVKPTIT